MGPYWENIGPWSFLYGPRCPWSVLSRPRADILPVRPSCLVNKIYIYTGAHHLIYNNVKPYLYLTLDNVAILIINDLQIQKQVKINYI